MPGVFDFAELVFWLSNFVISLGGLFIALYIVITHDDMKKEYVEPVELSDTLIRYCPIDYAISLLYFALAFLSASSYGIVLVLPMAVYNLGRFFAKDHKQYFIT